MVLNYNSTKCDYKEVISNYIFLIYDLEKKLPMYLNPNMNFMIEDD